MMCDWSQDARRAFAGAQLEHVFQDSGFDQSTSLLTHHFLVLQSQAGEIEGNDQTSGNVASHTWHHFGL